LWGGTQSKSQKKKNKNGGQGSQKFTTLGGVGKSCQRGKCVGVEDWGG